MGGGCYDLFDKRRREFLDQIYRQYQTTNLPVHYSDVAEAIGVSKWTAYDVLKTLESQGLLKERILPMKMKQDVPLSSSPLQIWLVICSKRKKRNFKYRRMGNDS